MLLRCIAVLLTLLMIVNSFFPVPKLFTEKQLPCPCFCECGEHLCNRLIYQIPVRNMYVLFPIIVHFQFVSKEVDRMVSKNFLNQRGSRKTKATYYVVQKCIFLGLLRG